MNLTAPECDEDIKQAIMFVLISSKICLALLQDDVETAEEFSQTINQVFFGPTSVLFFFFFFFFFFFRGALHQVKDCTYCRYPYVTCFNNLKIILMHSNCPVVLSLFFEIQMKHVHKINTLKIVHHKINVSSRIIYYLGRQKAVKQHGYLSIKIQTKETCTR